MKVYKGLLSFVGDTVHIAYALSASIVCFYLAGITPASLVVLYGYWAFMFASLLLVVTTILRWLFKWPKKITWLRLAYGTTGLATLMYTSKTLLQLYYGDETYVYLVPVLLSVTIPPLTLLVAVLAQRALKTGFRM